MSNVLNRRAGGGEGASSDASESGTPGKRTRTEAAVQRRAAAPAATATDSAPAIATPVVDDPFALHLVQAPGDAAGRGGGAVVQRKEAGGGGGWVERAREYNRAHQSTVDAFNAATGNACVIGGEVDPDAIARWQVAHQVPPDGRVGPTTLMTAKAPGGAANAAVAPAPAANAPAANAAVGHAPAANAPGGHAASSAAADQAPAGNAAGGHDLLGDLLSLSPAAAEAVTSMIHKGGAAAMKLAEQAAAGAADAMSSLADLLFGGGGGADAPANPPAAAGPDAPAGGPVLPEPKHVDGDEGGTPEPVKPPSGGASAPSKPDKGGNAPAGAPGSTKEKLYGKNGVGGIIGVDKLSKHSEVTVKGEKVSIDLSDAEMDFKVRVYKAATARLGDKLYGGVPEDELQKFSGGKMRPAAYGALNRMLDAMRADIAKGEALNGVEVGPGSGIDIGSTYRSPVQDFNLWDQGFNEQYLWKTKGEREKKWPNDPFGDEAVKFMVHWIGERKAAPGGSNHSNGIAVDLKCKVNGSHVPNSFGNQVAWRKSWQYQWLKLNAAAHSFQNYEAEAWHYDYRGPI